MAALDRRYLLLQIDTLKIRGVGSPGLRVSFKAKRDLKPEPNSCDVKIYNLSPDQRANLTKAKAPVVSLTAGYADDNTQIFFGQAVHVRHERAGPDIITTVSTSDGGEKYQKSRIKQSFGPRTKAGEVLRSLVRSLGVKAGNLEAAARKLDQGKGASVYIEGVTLTGHSATLITALCRSAGLEWSIQDDGIQIIEVGSSVAQSAIVLHERLLIGTPSISGSNVVEGRTFIQKDFVPGRQVQIRSEFVSGAFRLEKCSYQGDTHTDDWAVDFEAKGPPPA